MHTPPMRRRVTRFGVLIVAVLIVIFDVVVYVALRDGLESSLDEVLATRLELVTDLGADLEVEELADRLTSLGVPATIHTDEDVIITEPTVRRHGVTPPVPPSVEGPYDSRAGTLDDGTVVEVFATRAGVHRTLDRLLLILALGSVGALILAYVALRRLVDQTMDPLGQVAATAERIADGKSGERLEPDQPDTELGRMAYAFDDMLEVLEAAVEEATDEQERTRRFLADAAHQLRTPVAGIRGAAELLLQENDPQVRDQMLAIIVRETARSGRLISSLMHIARLDQGQPPQRGPTDLVALCRDEVERARDLAPQLTVGFDAELSPGPVEIDHDEISEALANLLDNARRHAATEVSVRLGDRNGSITIEVSDDGPGVPPGAENLIFERFATLDARGGSGLGLPIARAVARAHGGELTYEGDTFILRLPVS